MRFQNKKEEFAATVETVCLILSLGAVFLQIWILISVIEGYFQGKDEHLLPAVLLSGIAFAGCGMSALLTRLDFLNKPNPPRYIDFNSRIIRLTPQNSFCSLDGYNGGT